MSYILDALRKADAQRERARAPGLHDQPHETVAAAPARAAWPAIAGGLAALVVVGGVLAWALGDPAAPAVPAAAPMPQPAPIAAAPAPAPMTAPAPAIAPAPAPAAAVLPPAEPAPVRTDPAPARPVATATAALPAPGAQAPARAASRTAADAVPEPLPTTAPAGAPRIAISGGVWSPNPAQRMLVVGGQVANEGSELAPGLVLEQVRQGNRAVLSWQGQRWLAAY